MFYFLVKKITEKVYEIEVEVRLNRWQFVLDGKNEEGLDQSPCGWYVQNTKRSCTHGPECQGTEFLDDFPQLFS